MKYRNENFRNLSGNLYNEVNSHLKKNSNSLNGRLGSKFQHPFRQREGEDVFERLHHQNVDIQSKFKNLSGR